MFWWNFVAVGDTVMGEIMMILKKKKFTLKSFFIFQMIVYTDASDEIFAGKYIKV